MALLSPWIPPANMSKDVKKQLEEIAKQLDGASPQQRDKLMKRLDKILGIDISEDDGVASESDEESHGD